MTKKEQLIEQINKLKQERNRLKNLANIQDLAQLAYKIFLNSTYGALGSVFYPCFDLDNAEAVTLSGQTVTREMVRFTNQILNELVNKENEGYVIAGDTDSASGLTKLRIKRLFSRKITIFDQEKNIYKTLIFKPLDLIKVKRNNKIMEIFGKDINNNDTILAGDTANE